MKAALLSAMVFPGVGHFFLKKYVTAIVLAGATFVSLYWVISKTVERALQITEKIQQGEIQLDVTAITEILSKQSTGTEAQLLNIASVALIICWLIGIVDSYRIGRLQVNSDVVGD